MLRRTGWFTYSHDMYGKAWGRDYLGRTLESLRSTAGGRETMFKNRVGFEDVEYVIVSDPVDLIRALRKQGMTEWIDGRPLDEIIVAPGHPLVPRGQPKLPTPGATPGKPFVVASNEDGDGPAQTLVTVPKGYEPVVEKGWKGEWVLTGEVTADGSPRWRWVPDVPLPVGLTSTTGQPLKELKAKEGQPYKFSCYTASKDDPPAPYASKWGEWKWIKTSTAGYGEKWGWFPK